MAVLWIFLQNSVGNYGLPLIDTFANEHGEPPLEVKNLIQHLRRCHLRKKVGTITEMALRTWHEVFAAVDKAMFLTMQRRMASG